MSSKNIAKTTIKDLQRLARDSSGSTLNVESKLWNKDQIEEIVRLLSLGGNSCPDAQEFIDILESLYYDFKKDGVVFYDRKDIKSMIRDCCGPMLEYAFANASDKTCEK